MGGALMLTVAGFILTTVLGGLLGAYLQQRTWDHQNETRLREEELQRASEVCHAVSGLLDKRRYRMLRVYFAIRNRARESITTDELDERLSDYDRILYEWNDALNVNLAMIGTYFGQHARDSLAQAYEIYRDVGSELEIAYRAAADEMQPVRLDELNRQLEMLNDTAYRISLFMMTQLREGNVGRHAEQPVATPQLLG